MKTYASSSQENKQQSVANSTPRKQNSYGSRLQFIDNRPEAIAQMKLHETMNNSHKVRQLKNIQENVNSNPLIQKVSVIQRVDIGTVASNFKLTKKGASADI